jgi:hypothetical protein
MLTPPPPPTKQNRSQGGHFAALEQPELLTAEIVKFADLVDAKGWLKG